MTMPSVSTTNEADTACSDATREILGLESQCERVVVSDGAGQVVFRRLGSGSPLILLHGGHGSWLHWIRNARQLAQSHTVWMPDMPGYGESSAVASGELTELVTILYRCLMRAVGPAGAWALVGFSFGGVVAGCLSKMDEGIGRLALIGPVGHGARRRQLSNPLPWKHLAPEDRSETWRQVMRHNLLAQMLHKRSAVDDLALEVHSRSCLMSRFHSKRYSRSAALRESLKSYKGKALLLWGEDDVTASPEVFDLAAWTSAGTRQLVVQPDCGHWAMYEAPREIEAQIRRILD